MEVKDYYRILGVDKSATQDQIKSAYRKLAMKYHPDKTKGDPKSEEKFKEVNESYEVLKDPEKKKIYNRYGENLKYYEQSGQQGDFDWSQFTGGSGSNYSYSTGDFDSSGFSDFFENLFGGRRRSGFSGQGRTFAFKGQDIEAVLAISLEDAYLGTPKTFLFEGQSIKLNIKPGIKDGQVLKLSGKGRAGINGGANGDLFVTIRVEPDSRFERRGDNLYTDLNIDMSTAILGGKDSLKIFKKTVSLNIKPDTQSGKSLKIPGQGMPLYGNPGKYGDLYVKVQIKIPENLSADQKRKIEDLKASLG